MQLGVLRHLGLDEQRGLVGSMPAASQSTSMSQVDFSMMDGSS
jgi:hypothetical protein